jgi:hypothetical protein
MIFKEGFVYQNILAHIYNERMRKAKKMAAFWLAAPSSGL